MKHLKSALSWLQQRTTAVLVLLFVSLYLAGEWVEISYKQELKEASDACKTECFPKQHHYLYENGCWCATDEKTLIKKGE